MDIQRVNRDLFIARQEGFRNFTWILNALGYPSFIRVDGAFLLDPKRFNLPDCNLLIPVPSNLYETFGYGKYAFYKYVYVDEALRIRQWPFGWRPIKRGYDHNLYQSDGIPKHSGWQWICVKHPTCKADDNILTLISSVQIYIHTDA